MRLAKSIEYVPAILGNFPNYTFLNSSSIDSALNGGFSVTISYITQPMLHMSLLWS